MMSEVLSAFKDPKRAIVAWLVVALLGVEVVPMLTGDSEELERYRRMEAEAKLKEEIYSEVGSIIEGAVKPLIVELEQVNRDLKRGSRWALEDEIDLWIANGKQGVDPTKIQEKRLADERRALLNAPSKNQ